MAELKRQMAALTVNVVTLMAAMFALRSRDWLRTRSTPASRDGRSGSRAPRYASNSGVQGSKKK